jgi:hypothetical protein
MALGSISVVVGTTPTFLGSIDKSATIDNKNAASVFVGGPDVTTTNGVDIAPTTATLRPAVVFGTGKLYAVSAAGGGTAIRVLLS